jgi:hypothetical protein
MEKYLSLYQSFVFNVVTSKYFLERSQSEQALVLEFLERESFKKTCGRVEERINKIFDPSVFYKK